MSHVEKLRNCILSFDSMTKYYT